KKRYEHNNQIRISHGRPALTVETTLLQAMRRGLPACSGVALGVDRLLMLRVDADSIEDVIPLPTTRA
ncbi:amino acid--tRNA ligase-related protein, partial [Rhodopirellula bahusiensis]